MTFEKLRRLMLLLDVNILVYAHRMEMPEHVPIRQWLTDLIDADTPFGVPEIVMCSFVRIVTRRPFAPATPLAVALDFCNAIATAQHALIVRPRETQWQVFERLCRRINASGSIVQDAYLAAMALDQSCEWITADADFARFPGLSWRHPLAKTTTVNPN